MMMVEGVRLSMVVCLESCLPFLSLTLTALPRLKFANKDPVTRPRCFTVAAGTLAQSHLAQSVWRTRSGAKLSGAIVIWRKLGLAQLGLAQFLAQFFKKLDRPNIATLSSPAFVLAPSSAQAASTY